MGQLKAEAAAALAAEKSAQRDLNDLDASIEKYGKYARTAVLDGEEADARKFLVYQQDLKAKRPALAGRVTELEENSRKMREMTQKLHGDMDVIASRLRGLKSQVAVVRQQERMNQLNAEGGALSQLNKIEKSLQQRQDQADAMAELGQSADSALDDLIRKYDQAAADAVLPETDPVEEALRRLKEESGE